MPAPVYTRRLFAAHPVAGGSTSIWFVPAGATYILRSVTLGSLASAAQRVMLLLYTGSPSIQVIVCGAQLSQYDAQTVELRQALIAGDEFRVYNSVGESSVIASGYVFTSG